MVYEYNNLFYIQIKDRPKLLMYSFSERNICEIINSKLEEKWNECPVDKLNDYYKCFVNIENVTLLVIDNSKLKNWNKPFLITDLVRYVK